MEMGIRDGEERKKCKCQVPSGHFWSAAVLSHWMRGFETYSLFARSRLVRGDSICIWVCVWVQQPESRITARGPLGSQRDP